MAFVGDYTCLRCHTLTYGLVRKDKLCPKCVAEDEIEASRKRRVFLAGLTGLSMDERVARIEALLYDGHFAGRITDLENMVHPPTY